jgi:hypothetical protein
LPEELKPLLTPLALHERFVLADILERMVNSAEISRTLARSDQFLHLLETAGLLHPYGQGTYAMHPALTGFLS